MKIHLHFPVYFLILLSLYFSLSTKLLAQDSSTTIDGSLLFDRNGDGVINILFFGDSVTSGVGDGFGSEEEVFEVDPTVRTAGFPNRVSDLLQVNVIKRGLPGEVFINDGINRFAQEIIRSNADVVFFLEGLNDAIFRTSSGEYENAIQKVINITNAVGKTPVIGTLPPPCCDRKERSDITNAYSNKVRDVTRLNNVKFTDFERLWNTVCPSPERCSLVNKPEGLHPNTRGYDGMAQLVVADLQGVDLFSLVGIQSFSSITGIPAESVITSRFVRN